MGYRLVKQSCILALSILLISCNSGESPVNSHTNLSMQQSNLNLMQLIKPGFSDKGLCAQGAIPVSGPTAGGIISLDAGYVSVPGIGPVSPKTGVRYDFKSLSDPSRQSDKFITIDLNKQSGVDPKAQFFKQGAFYRSPNGFRGFVAVDLNGNVIFQTIDPIADTLRIGTYNLGNWTDGNPNIQITNIASVRQANGEYTIVIVGINKETNRPVVAIGAPNPDGTGTLLHFIVVPDYIQAITGIYLGPTEDGKVKIFITYDTSTPGTITLDSSKGFAFDRMMLRPTRGLFTLGAGVVTQSGGAAAAATALFTQAATSGITSEIEIDVESNSIIESIPLNGVLDISSNKKSLNMAVSPDGVIAVENIEQNPGVWVLESEQIDSNYYPTGITYESDNNSFVILAILKSSLQSGLPIFTSFVSRNGNVWTNASIPDFTKISTGTSFTCGIANESNGSVGYCWGSGESGDLGYGGIESIQLPKEVGGRPFSLDNITVGGMHACSLINSTTNIGDYIYCWGNNGSGQLGNGKSVSSLIPGPIAFGGGFPLYFKAVKAGANHTCAIDSKNQLWCWGDNSYGQLGKNPITTPSSNVPVLVASGTEFAPKSLALGANHTCAIAKGTSDLYCFGRDDMGQVGNGVARPYIYTPVLISDSFVKAFAGNNNTCGIESNGTTSCWGDNSYGQLGDGKIGTPALFPESVIEVKFTNTIIHI